MSDAITDTHAYASDADDMRRRFEFPDAVREALLPHENIVWTQRGHGARWPLVYWIMQAFQIALAFAFVGVSLAQPGMPAPTQLFLLVFGVGITCLILLLTARIVFGPPSETYVLTDLRVIHCSTYLNAIVRSLAIKTVTGENERLITRIAVWGRRDRGWIMLRSDSDSGTWIRSSFGMTSLVGVERPLEIAALIKKTLNLDFGIEDHTRK